MDTEIRRLTETLQALCYTLESLAARLPSKTHMEELFERRQAALERYRLEHEREHGPTCKTDDTGEDEIDRQ